MRIGIIPAQFKYTAGVSWKCRHTPVWISLVIMVVVSSCNLEKRLAKDYLQQSSPKAVLLMHTDYLYKSNKKTDSIPGYRRMSQDQRDSMLFVKSTFIQYLNDSLVIQSYTESLAAALRSLGYKVYDESRLDSFLLLNTPAFMLNLAQIEAEEYAIPFVDTQVFDDTLKYTRKFGLNAVNLNCWFELTRLNSDTAAAVLFGTHSASDQVNGRFKRHPLLLEVSYKYSRYQISIQDLYNLVAYAGNKDAGYLNDYLLNEAIKKELPPEFPPQTYWHYDAVRNVLEPANEWKFVRLK